MKCSAGHAACERVNEMQCGHAACVHLSEIKAVMERDSWCTSDASEPHSSVRCHCLHDRWILSMPNEIHSSLWVAELSM